MLRRLRTTNALAYYTAIVITTVVSYVVNILIIWTLKLLRPQLFQYDIALQELQYLRVGYKPQPSNTRPGWKGLTVTNPLAYYNREFCMLVICL